MKLSGVLVTGGAGFIGANLVDRLVQKSDFVRVVDNLSSSNEDNIRRHFRKPNFEFCRGDLKDLSTVERALNGVETVFHLAANPEVRVAEVDPSIHFRENLAVTFNVLEGMRKSRSAKLAVFMSSSTVYGEPLEFPTSEGYGPVLPISVYGATKLGCEALISSFCGTFGLRGLIFRLANIVGGESNHGVIVDFIGQLQSNPKELKILGDGTQTKSYLHVRDLVDAIFLALEDFLGREKTVDVYNVGSVDRIDVHRIAQVVAEEMGLHDLTFKVTGGVDGGRGWKGDVKKMQLSVKKLVGLGWKPKLNSEEAVRKSCQEILRAL